MMNLVYFKYHVMHYGNTYQSYHPELEMLDCVVLALALFVKVFFNCTSKYTHESRMFINSGLFSSYKHKDFTIQNCL
jgi:hypothetical protein